MLKKAKKEDVKFIKEIIHQYKGLGVFETILTEKDADTKFYNKLSIGLETGKIANISSPLEHDNLWGYIYSNEDFSSKPLGFCLFKGGGVNKLNEFWLTAIDKKYTGKGLGTLMINEAFTKSRNGFNLYSRCDTSANQAKKILLNSGFTVIGNSDGSDFIIDQNMAAKFKAVFKKVFNVN